MFVYLYIYTYIGLYIYLFCCFEWVLVVSVYNKLKKIIRVCIYLFTYIFIYIYLLYTETTRPPRSNESGLLNSRRAGENRDIVPYLQYEFHSQNFRCGWSMVRYRSRYNNNSYQCNEKGCNDNAKKIKARPTWL